MKKQNSKKLVLARETLVPLTPEVLDAVAGGQATTTTATSISLTLVSRVICPPTLQTCTKPQL